VGLPPFFVRDGVSGDNNWISEPTPPPGQTIPFRILPFEEMPQALNPANGFFANANNDPAGTSLDNDPLNQRRLSDPNAIYYLNPGYSDGLRSGRITRLVRERVENGPPITSEDMREFQRNTQQLDAELLVPFLLDAFAHAGEPSAPDELAGFASDAQLAEAVTRLAAWDFSTPTGVPQGWDASDEQGELRVPVQAAEVAASVAATIYNVWRGQVVRRVVDDRLAALGLSGVDAGNALAALHNLLVQAPFTGVGASGVDFFPEPAGLDADERRDVVLLAALRAALDRLAGPEFAAAFSGATDLDAYRWGMLHRVTFRHQLGGEFSLPPYAGFEDLSPELPGLPRDGGYEVVNASGFSARAQGVNEFRFGGGPVRRYVGTGGGGERRFGVEGWNTVPSVTGDPPDATQLRFWLTGDHHVVRMEPFEVDLFAERVEEYAPPAP
jgi:penicillin amidase